MSPGREHSLPAWPPTFHAGPFDRDGAELYPPGTPPDEAEQLLRRALADGKAIGLHDAAGRLVMVLPGHGLVCGEASDITGLTAVTVFAPEHARLMSLLWSIAADIAEQRQLAAGVFSRRADR